MKKSSIPNIFTFINLSCGILSILSTYNSNYIYSCLFILIAGLVDRYDGRVARFLDVTSEVGKELDSLADLVTFCVAPSILCYTMYSLNNLTLSNIIWNILLVVFPICGAYRLARYNSTEFNGVFTGIPITVAGSVLSILIILNKYILIPNVIIGLLIVGLSYLMVSNIKFKKR